MKTPASKGLFWLIAACAALGGPVELGGATLEEGFANPPRENRPVVWWWFANEAPEETITLDLEAMKRAGLGGFHFRKFPKDRAKFRFALGESARLGLDAVTMVGAAGCSHEGLDPAYAQKELVWSVTDVTGGAPVSRKLRRGNITPRIWNEKPLGAKLHRNLAIYAVPKADGPVPLDRIVDVTDRFEERGDILKWDDAPAGEWRIYRFGWIPKQNGWIGNSIDHMSRKAYDIHWDAVVTPLLAGLSDTERGALKGIVCDSWEAGLCTWTPGFEEEFRRRRGYPIGKLLVVRAGVKLAEEEEARRFDRDYDLTVADLITENHYAYKREVARRHGLVAIAEAAGPHQSQGDVRRMQGQVDVAMGEAWMPCAARRTDAQRFMVRDAASAAHVYGIPEVLCETFTTIKTYWTEGLSDLKPCADRAFCDGMTRVCWHGMQHSDSATDRPGRIRDIGPHYTRNTTWFEQSRAFNLYLARCSWMLSQGRFAADCLLYAGDAKDVFVGCKRPTDALGEGYDYDICPTEVLLDARVEDGEIALKSGMRYKALFVSDINPAASARMRSPDKRAFPPFAHFIPGEARAKLDGLKKLGATVFETRAEMEAYLKKGVLSPDFTAEGMKIDTIDWVHRTAKGAEIYFVANRTGRPKSFTASFRQTCGEVSLWDPVTGERFAAPSSPGDGRIGVPISLDAHGSVFVVFSSRPVNQAIRQPRQPSYQATLSGPWSVQFDPAWGGPREPVEMPTLRDWTSFDDPRIRYYSGTAVYRTKIGLPAGKGRRWLDLGRLAPGNVAEVFDGDRSLGVAWTAPYRVEVTGAGDLSVRVTNLWPNRLIYDSSLPEKSRLTRTNINPYRPQDKPLSSGLLGPVLVISE